MATAILVPARMANRLAALPTIPASFEEALRAGWVIQGERSAISIDDRKRRGVVTLRKPGITQQLQVSYTATAKKWQFSKPELA